MKEGNKGVRKEGLDGRKGKKMQGFYLKRQSAHMHE